MSRPRNKLAALMGALVLLTCLCSCRTSGLAFVRDQRVQLSAPAVGAETGDTVDVRWSYTGRPLGSAGAPARFAVFVDTAPIEAGQRYTKVARLANGKPDKACLQTAGCVNEAYLQARGLYLTTARHVRVQLASVTHLTDRTLTVVLLDSAGRRIGESAWSVDIRQRELALSTGRSLPITPVSGPSQEMGAA